MSGSSPLARGLPQIPESLPIHSRIIPARAGFTDRLVPDVRDARDHPRSRGVYRFPRSRRITTIGSSPLARGLLRIGEGVQMRRGIIPARAGFTSGRTGSTSPARDHPRSRGVYEVPLTIRISQVGSSPLARGLRAIDLNDGRLHRIIPARAGFTRQREERREPCWDHPRSRGVY